MNRHDSRQWDAQNNINVYRREGSTVRLLHRDLEEIRRDLEKKNERLETENERLREALEIGIRWMDEWLKNDLCECEGVHTCGKKERTKELEYMRQSLEGGGKQSTG